jgi:hypothetical protein
MASICLRWASDMAGIAGMPAPLIWVVISHRPGFMAWAVGSRPTAATRRTNKSALRMENLL